jgi:hypothetical protein
MKTTHAATPWDERPGMTVIGQVRLETIKDHRILAFISGMSAEETKANARLVVAAVNSYQLFLNASEALIKAFPGARNQEQIDALVLLGKALRSSERSKAEAKS